MNSQLELVIGDNQPIYLNLVDEHESPENLTGADAAHFTIVDKIGGTVILDRSTGAGNLSIDTVNSRIVVTISLLEANGLVAGSYIAELAVRYTTIWKHTDRFFVTISKAIAPST